MRRLLDYIYRGSGAVAASALCLICLLVTTQVVFRLIDAAAGAAAGERLGLVVPSAAEFSGYLLAASSFLALAYTLRHGGHIRVSLLANRLPDACRRPVELWCLAAGSAVTAFFCWHTAAMVVDSWRFHEMSYGIIPVPLWIPQSFMLAGLVVLTVAFVDDFLASLVGSEVSYAGAEQGDGDAVFAE